MRTPINGSSRIHAFQFGPVFKSLGAKVRYCQPFPSTIEWIDPTSIELMGSKTVVRKIAGRVLHDFLWFVILPVTRVFQFPLILKYDVVIIQKGVTELWEHKLFEKAIIYLTKALGKTFIYHFDDMIIGKNMRSVTNYLIKKAEVVITVNKILINYGMKINSNIFLIPENIKDEEIAPIDHIKHDIKFPVTIGWIGLGGGYKFEALESIGPAIERVAKEFQVKMKVVSNYQFSFSQEKHIAIENVEWTQKQERQFNCDIGINPVPQQMTGEGKGSFKLLKYMAHGIPSVTSWTCDDFNKNEQTCLVAKDADDWYAQLKRLISDNTLRKHLVINGINEAKKYCTSTLGKEYFDIIKRTVKKEKQLRPVSK
jgi:glycosyltransferase involved in cell wall biosynthesis